MKIHQSLKSKWQRVMTRLSCNESESDGFKFTIRYPTSRVECCIPQASTSKVCPKLIVHVHVCISLFEYPSISNSNAYAVLALLDGMQGLPFHIAQCVYGWLCIVCDEK